MSGVRMDGEAGEVAAMRRAVALADNGPGRGVNPRVGCVVLAPDGSVLAEGWHRGAGTPHAEVDAISHLAGGRAAGATVVVTLEPCNHTGHTGPCTEALIAAGVARVVYAVTDPGRKSGGGGARLRTAGIDVVSGVLADEASEQLHDWLIAERRGTPYVTVKWASSLDGRIAAGDGTSRWITGAAARMHVHERRAASDAILTGTGTVLADDPGLTARGDGGELLAAQPIPVVVGSRRIPENAAVLRHPHAPLVYTHHDLGAVLCALYARGVRHLLVEGGPRLTSAFVAAELVDEYLIYLAPSLIGGSRGALDDVGVGTIGEQRRLDIRGVEALGRDILVRAIPLRGPAASASLTSPSADAAVLATAKEER